MATSTQEPRPLISGLGSYYDTTRDLSWLVVRATAGGMTARGQALLLLPKGTLTRLGAR